MQVFKTADEVSIRITEMAAQIVDEYKDSTPLFVCLLRGSNPFASMLMFAITKLDRTFHPQLEYMMISTYGDERVGHSSQVVMDLPASVVINDRHVIVLDDVLDKGLTASFTEKHLVNKGAALVDLIVLAQKDIERTEYHSAKMYGFSAPDKWLVGMGMDDTTVAVEGNRWLNYIAMVN